MNDLTAARTALVGVLAAYHAQGEHFIDLLCAATDDLTPEQGAEFLAYCLAGDLDPPAASEPARAKARRPREVPGQGSLF